MASSAAGTGPGAPHWLADAMLGKLARYLRFLGHDTAYARDAPDAVVEDRARREHRTLLTRDRALAARVPGSLLLRTPDLPGQLREVATAFPSLSFVVTLDRCPECNVLLGPWSASDDGAPVREQLPAGLDRANVAVVQCPECRRRYWEGSHAARIRSIVATALQGGGPG